jgi:hypothetical protein
MAHDQEVVGSNHGIVYWMDKQFIKNKGSQMGHTNKIFKKPQMTIYVVVFFTFAFSPIFLFRICLSFRDL